MFGLFGLGMMEAEMGMMMGAQMGMMMGGMGGYGRYGRYGRGGQTVIICPPGCMGPCCANRVMCAPGCMGPCCINRPMMTNQTYMNSGQMVPYGQMPYNGQTMTNQQMMRANQMGQRMPNYQNGQMAPTRQTPQYGANNNQAANRRRVQTTAQQQNVTPRQKQAVKEEVIVEEERSQLTPVRQEKVQGQSQALLAEELEMESMEGRQQARQRQQKQMEDSRRAELDQYAEVGLLSNNQRDQQVLFQGDVYQQSGGKWNLVKGAILTSNSFMNIRIQNILKLKIKAQSQVNGTRMLKITDRSGDHFFCVRVQEQVEWMMKLVWAKLISMGVMCKIVSQYSGHVASPILRKTFFGGWERNYGMIEGQVFKISEGMNVSASKKIEGVPEIWTRFELVNGNMMVVKMHSGGKLEVAVPIEKGLVWLRGLYNIIRY